MEDDKPLIPIEQAKLLSEIETARILDVKILELIRSIMDGQAALRNIVIGQNRLISELELSIDTLERKLNRE